MNPSPPIVTQSADPHHPRNVVVRVLRTVVRLQRAFHHRHGDLDWMVELCTAMEALPEIIASIPCRDREARREVARQTRHWRRDKLEIDRIRLGMQYHALARQGVDPVKLITARMALAVTVAMLGVLDWIRSRPVLPDDRRRRIIPSDDPVPEAPEHARPESTGPPGAERTRKGAGPWCPPQSLSTTAKFYAGLPWPAIPPSWVLLHAVMARLIARYAP